MSLCYERRRATRFSRPRPHAASLKLAGVSSSPPPPAAPGDSEPGPPPTLPGVALWSDSDPPPVPVTTPVAFSGLVATPADRAMPTIGHIGRYALKYQLGEGGLGTVFAAHDPLLSRLIAVKTLNVKVTDDERESLQHAVPQRSARRRRPQPSAHRHRLRRRHQRRAAPTSRWSCSRAATCASCARKAGGRRRRRRR